MPGAGVAAAGMPLSVTEAGEVMAKRDLSRGAMPGERLPHGNQSSKYTNRTSLKYTIPTAQSRPAAALRRCGTPRGSSGFPFRFRLDQQRVAHYGPSKSPSPIEHIGTPWAALGLMRSIYGRTVTTQTKPTRKP